ncbi:Protein N-acetyltransferase, RimJ/RimL family [Collimonas sp. OK307]|uniref:GNAT family N-acetyltransferase n=1 Tax=Collimonas sp. OK307 TaxID=1801620 RepID=UPI0008DFCA1F|nr:GNAT family N-acetyltransferase [Collimonas sp. OK307]SFH95590.1 Protein N-acetyltransferase, RimJ/RimL family [Collimonas sp. OK307]
MKVLETERLILRTLNEDDADFYLKLVTQPAWLRFIGDRGIRTVEAARAAILNGPMAAQELYGFSFYMTELKDEALPIGICGLIKRETLPDVDIGYAFLPEFWGKGYAYEAASAVLEHGKRTCGLQRIVAITAPDNHQSIRVLEKIGLKFEKMLQLKDDGSETKLFGSQF